MLSESTIFFSIVIDNVKSFFFYSYVEHETILEKVIELTLYLRVVDGKHSYSSIILPQSIAVLVI